MKILIRNLSRDVTETELHALFKAFGTVQSCVLVMDQKTGGSKGFGFVEMPKVGEAKAAIKSLNNQLVGDQKIRVKKAEDKPTTDSTRIGLVEASPVDTETKQAEQVAIEKSQVAAVMTKPEEAATSVDKVSTPVVDAAPKKIDPYAKSRR